MHREVWEKFGRGSDDRMGIDVSENRWVTLRIGLLLKAAAPDERLREQSVRNEFLGSIESTSIAVANELGRLTERAVFSLDTQLSRMKPGTKRELFPFLPSQDRGVRFEIVGVEPRFLVERFDARYPLTGQVADLREVIGILKVVPIDERFALSPGFRVEGDPGFGVPIAIISLDAVALQEGSFFSWEHFRVDVLGVILAGAGIVANVPPATEQMKQWWENHEAATAIIEVIHKDANVQFRALDFPFVRVYDEAGRAFNYEEPGITKAESRRRCAILQATLAAYYKTDIDVDGDPGKETHELLAHFAKEHNLPASVQNKILRAYLARVARPFR